MKRKHKEMMSRIFLGIVIFTVLVILIIPKPQTVTNTPSSENFTPINKVIITHTVSLTSKGFDPQKITIKKGEVIIWINKSGKEASVNSADYPTHKLFRVLNLGTFNDGSSVQARIYRIGELRYVNHYIPAQTGTIIVEE